MGSEAEDSSVPVARYWFSKPDLGALAEQLLKRFTSSEDAKLALGMAQSPAAQVENVIEDLLTLTVTTAVGEGEGQALLITNWSLDSDVETTISPNASALTGPVADLLLRQASSKAFASPKGTCWTSASRDPNGRVCRWLDIRERAPVVSPW